MTTYAKFDQTHADDERWLDAGADAMALHVAAVVWCDRQLTDGHITNGMALRVCLAVPPDRAPQAIAALVEHGFWRATAKGYRIERFHEHAFPADQVRRTRARWRADKDRRRQHNLGDHSLCKDPKFCPAIRDGASTVESTADGTTDGTVDSTRIDKDQTKTRPDRREGSGIGMGGGGSASHGGSASLAADSAAPPADQPTADTENAPHGSEPEPPWADYLRPPYQGTINGKQVTPDGLR